MSDATRRQIVDDAVQASEGLVKHPVATALGRLPSAIARICDEPELYLLFTVEMPSEANAQTDRPPAAAARRTPEQPVTPSVLNMAPGDNFTRRAGAATALVLAIFHIDYYYTKSLNPDT